MNTLVINCRSAAVSSSTNRSALTAPVCCGWSATQPRSACVFGVLCVCLFYYVPTILAAELKNPGPTPSDALFDHNRVIQVEIRLDPKDWHALRIGDPDTGYHYCRGDVTIDGKTVKSVGPAPDWPIQHRNPPPKTSRPSKPPMLVEGAFSAEIGETNPTNVVDILGQGSATLQYTLGGKTHTPFTRFGARAMTKVGERELIRVVMVASDPACGLRWNVTFTIDPYRMTYGPVTLELRPWVVFTALTQGEPNTPQAQTKLGDVGINQINGTLELTQVSTNLGGTISGKFTINTTAFEEEKKP